MVRKITDNDRDDWFPKINDMGTIVWDRYESNINEPVYLAERTCIDTDQDGIPTNYDNCPSNCNTQQQDADVDGIGDVCDKDDGCFSCGSNEPSCETEC